MSAATAENTAPKIPNHHAVRATSTHALQALSLFNSEFMHEQAGKFAARLERDCAPHDQGCMVDRAFHLALARSPRPAETQLASDFFRGGGLLEDFCLALLNRNEFIYVP